MQRINCHCVFLSSKCMHFSLKAGCCPLVPCQLQGPDMQTAQKNTPTSAMVLVQKEAYMSKQQKGKGRCLVWRSRCPHPTLEHLGSNSALALGSNFLLKETLESNSDVPSHQVWPAIRKTCTGSKLLALASAQPQLLQGLETVKPWWGVLCLWVTFCASLCVSASQIIMNKQANKHFSKEAERRVVLVHRTQERGERNLV